MHTLKVREFTGAKETTTVSVPLRFVRMARRLVPRKAMASLQEQGIDLDEIVRLIETQTAGKFIASDFVPVPCCFPTCNSVTYAFVEDGKVTLVSK